MVSPRKEVVMPEDALKDALEEATKEVDEQIAKEESATPETTEDSSPEEVSQEDKELQELDGDTDFQAAKKDLETEMGGKELTFNQTKRFRGLYRKLKESERTNEDLQSKVDAIPEPEPEMTETDLQKLAEKQGYKLSKEEKKDIAQLEEMLDKVQKPEDREWLKTYASAIKQSLTDEVAKKYDQPLNQMAQIVREYQLDMSERKARSLIQDINKKHGTQIDFDRDVDPELERMIKADKDLTPYNTDLTQLTQRYLAEKGIELGKKLSVIESQKLNEEKKKAAMESSGTSSAPKVDDSNSSIADIMKDEMSRQGIKGFF